MLKSAVSAIPVVLLVHTASAADYSGAGALALAAVVAAHDTALNVNLRDVIAKIFAGENPPYSGGKIMIKANKAECRQSNVEINARSCALTFGSHVVNISGRPAHELYATLIEAGVPSEGAAGSVFETLTALDCTIDPKEIKQNTGAGASCTFKTGG